MVGSDATLKLASELGRPKSHLTVVGLARGTLPFSFFALPYECSVATTYWGSVTELMEVVALAEAGRIAVRIETHALSQVAETYERLRQGMIEGRAVIVP